MSQVINFASGGSAGSAVQKLTGNTGGAILPDGSNNINIVGGTGITVNGNAGTNSLVINATGTTNVVYTNVAVSPYTVLATDYYLSVDCSVIPITIRFPNAATAGRIFIVKDRTGNAATNNITLTSVSGTVTFDGATSFVFNTNFEGMNLIGNSVSYEIF